VRRFLRAFVASDETKGGIQRRFRLPSFCERFLQSSPDVEAESARANVGTQGFGNQQQSSRGGVAVFEPDDDGRLERVCLRGAEADLLHFNFLVFSVALIYSGNALVAAFCTVIIDAGIDYIR